MSLSAATCTKAGYYQTAYTRRAGGTTIPKGTCLQCVSRLSTQYNTVQPGGAPSRCYKSIPNAARTHCGALLPTRLLTNNVLMLAIG